MGFRRMGFVVRVRRLGEMKCTYRIFVWNSEGSLQLQIEGIILEITAEISAVANQLNSFDSLQRAPLYRPQRCSQSVILKQLHRIVQNTKYVGSESRSECLSLVNIMLFGLGLCLCLSNSHTNFLLIPHFRSFLIIHIHKFNQFSN